jgi:hypothetical protein
VAASFESLVAEADTVSVEGWDFSWLDGRATEQRPSWGYQRMLGPRLGAVASALDVETGGGEVLAGVPALPPLMAATESWPPNVAKATKLRAEFSDIGPVVYFLRKVIWMVPDFSVRRYHDRLLALHERIERDGPFQATTTRFLIEARKSL